MALIPYPDPLPLVSPSSSPLHDHPLNLTHRTPPILRQQLAVLDPLARPVLERLTNGELRMLEEQQLVANALFDEDGAVVRLDDGFFILLFVSNTLLIERGNGETYP